MLLPNDPSPMSDLEQAPTKTTHKVRVKFHVKYIELEICVHFSVYVSVLYKHPGTAFCVTSFIKKKLA